MLGTKTGERRIPQGIYSLVHVDTNLLLSLGVILKVSDGREKISQLPMICVAINKETPFSMTEVAQ